MRENVEQARRLEALPNVAAAAHAGKLSDEQLGSVVKLADEASDAEWAARAPNTDPADLARLARNLSKPTTEDGQARREARGLRMWWAPGKGMLHIRGQLPDLMGARFEATITKLTDRMRPPRGEAWDTLEHRAADALDGMCDAVEVAEQVEAPTPAARPLLQVQVRADGPAEIAGIPLPDALIEQLRAQASIEPVLVDDHGVAVGVGKRVSALSPKIMRAVLLRDAHCRMPGCEMRHGLEVHHLQPRSWAGSDDISNLATVCRSHHSMLVPAGRWALLGNPNQPDGLRLERAQQLGRPPPRAVTAVA
jgi:hypothetical protein